MEPDGRRATIEEAVSLAGTGLHCGQPVRLRIAPAAPGRGVVFRRAGCDAELPATLENVSDDRNATTLRRGDARIGTVEHVLAALAMTGIDDAVVECDGPEPPAADGSAAPFVALLERAGRWPHGPPRSVVHLVEPVVVEANGGSIVAEPARAPAVALAVDYTIAFDAAAIGRQSLSLPHLDGATFAREIAGARTFGFLADVERLRAAGLARGAGLDNTVVVDGERVVNPEGLRWPDEFVRHKVLDLIGDLALLGRPLVARLRVHRGGHALHHALLRALCARPSAWREVP